MTAGNVAYGCVIAWLCSATAACPSASPQEGNATQTSPNEQDSATLFLPGIVSTRAIEAAGTFSRDGRTFVFARREGRWGSPGGQGVLYSVDSTAQGWTRPQRLPFSGEHDDGDPFFAPDGRFLFFTSRRPVTGKATDDHDIWVVEYTRSGWAQPRHLGPRVNSSGREYSPSVTRDGTIYFASTRDGGLGQGDIYVSRPDQGGYSEPRNLGSVVNSVTGEWNVFVAPDESFLIIEASGRATNRSPSGDLYISYRESGSWLAPVSLRDINTPESELNARLSPDGSRLFFARSVTEADGHRHASIHSVAASSVLPHLSDPRRSPAASR